MMSEERLDSCTMWYLRNHDDDDKNDINGSGDDDDGPTWP